MQLPWANVSLTLFSIALLVSVPSGIQASAQSAAFHPGGAVPSKHPAQPASAALSSQLDKLYASARRYATDLDKVTCDEIIHSEQNSSSQGFNPRPVHWKMDTTGHYTAVKSPTGVVGFKDDHDFVTQDGKPVPAGKKIVHPYMLTDAFGPAVLIYLSPLRRACLQFTKSSSGRIDFATLPGAGGHGDCADVAPDAKGFVLFDAGTHTISHLERTVPLEAGRAGGFAPFASVDYRPYGVKGTLYMLPAHIVAKKNDRAITLTFDAQYASCNLFLTDTLKIYDSHGNRIVDATRKPQ